MQTDQIEYTNDDLSRVAGVVLSGPITITACGHGFLVGHTFDSNKDGMQARFTLAVEILKQMRPDIESDPNFTMNVFCLDGLLDFPHLKSPG